MPDRTTAMKYCRTFRVLPWLTSLPRMKLSPKCWHKYTVTETSYLKAYYASQRKQAETNEVLPGRNQSRERQSFGFASTPFFRPLSWVPSKYLPMDINDGKCLLRNRQMNMMIVRAQESRARLSGNQHFPALLPNFGTSLYEQNKYKCLAKKFRVTKTPHTSTVQRGNTYLIHKRRRKRGRWRRSTWNKRKSWQTVF